MQLLPPRKPHVVPDTTHDKCDAENRALRAEVRRLKRALHLVGAFIDTIEAGHERAWQSGKPLYLAIANIAARALAQRGESR